MTNSEWYYLLVLVCIVIVKGSLSKKDAAANKLVQCLVDSDCGASEICEGKMCLVGCKQDEDCQFNEACFNRQCQDPCSYPDVCGINAKCLVNNHRPICTCPSSLTGDPNVQCSPDEAGLLRVCYFTNFDPSPSRLNTTLCTHIIAGFASVKDALIDIGNDSFKKLYREVTNLKKQDPDLKVLLTVGGGGNFNGFSPAISSLQNRTRFIASALTVLNDYDFDGLDIDWEFPVWNDYNRKDKENFIALLKEFKFGMALYNSMTGKSLLLTVAVAAPKNIVDKAYDVPEMAKYVDFINLMSYDFHDYFWYTPVTGHNSPLFNRSVEEGYFATLNTAWSAFYWNQQGMPKSKIMVGIPTYAHTYKLLAPSLHGVDAPATGIGMNGGDITFTEVCQFLSSGGVRVFDKESQVPYAYKGFDWISYEDEMSMFGKALWIKKNGFGGAMTYSLNTDDWSSACNSVPFPLHSILYHVFTH